MPNIMASFFVSNIAIILVTAVSILGLLYTLILRKRVNKSKVEDQKMVEIQSLSENSRYHQNTLLKCLFEKYRRAKEFLCKHS